MWIDYIALFKSTSSYIKWYFLCPSVLLSFPGGSYSKELTCNVGDLGLIPGLGGSPGEGIGYPLPYSGLENFMEFHGRLQSMGHKESDTTKKLSLFCLIGLKKNEIWVLFYYFLLPHYFYFLKRKVCFILDVSNRAGGGQMPVQRPTSPSDN